MVEGDGLIIMRIGPIYWISIVCWIELVIHTGRLRRNDVSAEVWYVEKAGSLES
jgi:hypothetical protein